MRWVSLHTLTPTLEDWREPQAQSIYVGATSSGNLEQCLFSEWLWRERVDFTPLEASLDKSSWIRAVVPP